MKRIEFIAPVEAMRGNLSGAQKLEYPTDNQGAYEGPAGSVNYARNYSPRFVGAKIARNGKKYFTVRTKTANHLTAKAKKAMALMGGTGAIVASLLRNKNYIPYQNMYACYLAAQELGDRRTFRKFATDIVMAALNNKAENITAIVGTASVSFKNPWYDGSQTSGVLVSSTILSKFWMVLAPDAIAFHVDSQVCYGKTGWSWREFLLSSLNYGRFTANQNNYIVSESTGEFVVLVDGADVTYQQNTDTIIGNTDYELTSVTPA